MVINSAKAEIGHEYIGNIVGVHGPVVIIACDRLPPLHQALTASIDHENYLFEVHQHLDEKHVRAITLHTSSGLRRGMAVYDTGAPVQVPVSPDCLGRLLNILANRWTMARHYQNRTSVIFMASRLHCTMPSA